MKFILSAIVAIGGAFIGQNITDSIPIVWTLGATTGVITMAISANK